MIGIEWIIFIVLVVIFLISGGVIGFIFLYRYIWNYTYVVIDESTGTPLISKKGRCKLMSFGDGGEEVFFLKGVNKWRASYGKRIGKNQICWVIGDDGYWYNIGFEGLNKKLRTLGILPVDRDMRYANSSIRKGIENRFNDKTFAEKYGSFILIGLLVIGIIAYGVGQFYALKQINVGLATNSKASETNKEVMEIASKVVASLAQLQNGGTGLRPG